MNGKIMQSAYVLLFHRLIKYNSCVTPCRPHHPHCSRRFPSDPSNSRRGGRHVGRCPTHRFLPGRGSKHKNGKSNIVSVCLRLCCKKFGLRLCL